MYVPMFKTRREELSVSKEMSFCFSNDIIPLFEILTDKYETKYRINPITNAFIYEKKGKRSIRIKEAPTENDIITLDYINNIMKGKKAFVDYFRFTIEKYGEKIDVRRTDLAYKLSRDRELYKSRIIEVVQYDNLIPVVSVKPGLDFRKNELKDFLTELQEEQESIALRITEEFFYKYGEVIKDILRKTDYLLFDIGEQNPCSKVMEFEEIKELKSDSNIILLNSPRKADKNNGEYNASGITDMIDNSARDIFEKYGFDGFGDYCGLKDTLPSSNKGNGTGAALALLYDYKENGFYSYLNPDTRQGMSGYYKVIKEIMKNKAILDPLGTCPAFIKIANIENSGNWGTWHNITITRYIHQMYQNT